jgi:predicted esterase
MVKILATAAAWAALACFVACSSSKSPTNQGSSQSGACTPGTSAQCTCSDGSEHTQSCGSAGTYDACPCPQGSGSSSGSGNAPVDAGGTSSGSSGGSSGSGSGGGSGGDASSGDSGGMTATMATVPQIPAAPASCPTLATGMVTVLGHQVQLWAGTKQAGQKGSVLFYWHRAGGDSTEAMSEMSAQISEIVAGGGLVASFTDSTKQGDLNDDIWYTGDFAMSDAILACAVQQLGVDPKRVYTAGCSAGGLMAGTMAYLRSSYIAAAMPNSGGILHPLTLENTHVPAVITAHGSVTQDIDVVYYEATSTDEDLDLASQGGFEVDCPHAFGHCGAPSDLIAAQWTFCKAHPFGVSPEPYASGLPSTLPSYCTTIKAPADFDSTEKCKSGKPCGNSQVCCYTPGPYGANYTGESSSCVTPGAQNGSAGQCPSNQLQLCTTTANCSGGQTCNEFGGGYCN